MLIKQQRRINEMSNDFRITNLARFLSKKFVVGGGKLFDVGAGSGLMLKFFKKNGFYVYGMEIIEDLYKLMKRDRQLKDVSIVQGDITTKKGKGNFDYVLACDVIEHIDNDVKALENLLSYLKPAGKLILTVPAHSYLFGKRDIFLGHYRRYDKQDLLKKIRMVQAKADTVMYWNFLGYFVYFFYEKILAKPVNDNFRYKKDIFSKLVSNLLNLALKIEELIGFTPIGLTLVASISKSSLKSAR